MFRSTSTFMLGPQARAGALHAARTLWTYAANEGRPRHEVPVPRRWQPAAWRSMRNQGFVR